MVRKYPFSILLFCFSFLGYTQTGNLKGTWIADKGNSTHSVTYLFKTRHRYLIIDSSRYSSYNPIVLKKTGKYQLKKDDLIYYLTLKDKAEKLVKSKIIDWKDEDHFYMVDPNSKLKLIDYVCDCPDIYLERKK